MTNGHIKPSIQAALDEAHPTGPVHHRPSIAGSHRKPGDDNLFDPQDPEMQGIPLAGDFGHPLQTPEQRRNMEALLDDNPTGPRDNEVIKAAKDAMIYGTGFVQMQGEDRMPGGDKPTEMELLRRPPVTSDLKQFENSYGTDFGTAILQMRAGCKVQREGWNGKDMWIALSGVEGPREVYSEKLWSKPARDYARAQPGGTVKVLPCFIMKTATGEILMGWLASQSDMLAQDWRVVP